jgi:hypothetical protein
VFNNVKPLTTPVIIRKPVKNPNTGVDKNEPVTDDKEEFFWFVRQEMDILEQMAQLVYTSRPFIPRRAFYQTDTFALRQKIFS